MCLLPAWISSAIFRTLFIRVNQNIPTIRYLHPIQFHIQYIFTYAVFSHHQPTCDNHDDGETPAIILCTDCGNLCAECDKVLHLHRKTRNHQRKVFKEEEEAIKVDLHEGCGRSKLFWIMTLADSKTLKAMVEFKEVSAG